MMAMNLTRSLCRALGVAALCFVGLACDSPAENAVEERQEQIEERAEERQDAIEDAGSVPPPIGDPTLVDTTATSTTGTTVIDATTTDAAPRP